jgi:hypothetical protein
MSLALKPVMQSLVRLGLIFVVGSSLAITLGLLYPVERELDLARYSNASFTSEVQGVFPAHLEPAIARAMAGDACLVSEWTTELRAGDVAAGPTQLDAVSPACGSVSRFPERSLLARTPARDPAWIDLSADTAKALGVGLGDTVSVVVGPHVAPVQLTVSGVYALRGGLEYAAQAPADVLFGHLPPGTRPGFGLMLTRADASRVLSSLDASPIRADLAEAKGYPPVVSAVADRLTSASMASSHTLGLVRTIGALCAIGMALLGLRELDVFRRSAAPVLLHIDRLGGPARRLVVTVLSLATATACLTVTTGIGIGAAAYRFGWIASCLPPTTVPLVWACWSMLMAYCACIGLLLTRATIRQLSVG